MKKGFTLLELLIVITIITIIGTFSSVFYSRFLVQNNASAVQDQLFSSLRKAYTYSVTSRLSSTSGWGVYFDNTNGKMVVFQGATYSSRNVALDETFSFAKNITFSFSNSLGITGISDIVFARVTGLPTPAGTTTITISGPNTTSKQVIVNSQGTATR